METVSGYVVECDGTGNTMKEMVGGCCVCSDERGWPDNPLVYCDGNACTVAVHQACYGIVTVPVGPWYCRKCESPDRQSKVHCELCPSRFGALKRVETGGWAHVVCALYIPEVRFGNVTSMEPIILQLIPPERFNKACYICQEMGKVVRASIGACMQCNKSGCRQQFHVTCAQGLGLLCEEAGNYLDNVKYCGYCQYHYGKLKKGGNVKTIPPYKPISQDSQSSDSSPEKDGESSTSSLTIVTPSTSVISTSGSSTSTPTPKNMSKSNVGRKAGQSATGKVSYTGTRTSSAVTSTITSSSAVMTDAPPKIIQNDAVASTSKAAITNAEKSGSKRWNSSPSQEVVTISSSTSTTCANNLVIQLSTSDGPGKLSKNSSGKGGISKSTAVITNTSTVTTNSSIISVPVSHLIEQPYVSIDSKEKIEADIYSASIDIKQTKKKKAVSQSTVQDLSFHSADASSSTNASVVHERSYIANERPVDSNTDDKLKKLKPEVSNTVPKTASISQPQAYTSGLNIQMEPNLMSIPHSSHSNAPMSRIPQISMPHVTIPSQSYMMERNLGHPMTSMPHSSNDVPMAMSSMSQMQGSNTIDLASTSSMSPQPSTSNWGLKVAYEPQVPAHSSSSKLQDADLLYSMSKRPRMDTVDMSMKSNTMNMKQQGAILIDSIDKMATIASGGVRNKKRTAAMSVNPPMIQTSIQNPIGNPQNLINSKRLNQVTPPPSTSSSSSYQVMHSPPISPDDKNHLKSGYNSRFARAPHMLGNELNPDSAAAARLSEHLNAELVAHSVFRPNSPLVPPPLMNRATSGGRYTIANVPMPISLGSGGAQSLDQLLERQWEQGSQFLMEQAQHFDIASLLSCLHQLRSENANLEGHVDALTDRRNHLLAVNARLAIPLNAVPPQPPPEHVRMSREAASSMARPPPPPMPQHSRPDMMHSRPDMQHSISELMGSERAQQTMMRDLQPKPS